MINKNSVRFVAMSAAVAGVLTGTGCLATRKHVATKLDPIEKRVTPLEDRMGKAEAKAKEQGTEIEAVETDLSRTKERVTDLDATTKKTNEQVAAVSNVANNADRKAGDADRKAGEARTYAETRSNTIEKFIEARDQFRLAKSESVLFGFAKSDLDDDGRTKLDEIAKDAMNRKRYIFEVQGFADNIGPALANLEISQKRAEAVVRYLNGAHKVPLRSIHLIGSGSDSPIAENNTRDGRRQNRRVEVRLFAPEVENSSSVTSAQLR